MVPLHREVLQSRPSQNPTNLGSDKMRERAQWIPALPALRVECECAGGESEKKSLMPAQYERSTRPEGTRPNFKSKVSSLKILQLPSFRRRRREGRPSARGGAVGVSQHACKALGECPPEGTHPDGPPFAGVDPLYRCAVKRVAA